MPLDRQKLDVPKVDKPLTTDDTLDLKILYASHYNGISPTDDPFGAHEKKQLHHKLPVFIVEPLKSVTDSLADGGVDEYTSVPKVANVVIKSGMRYLRSGETELSNALLTWDEIVNKKIPKFRNLPGMDPRTYELRARPISRLLTSRPASRDCTEEQMVKWRIDKYVKLELDTMAANLSIPSYHLLTYCVAAILVHQNLYGIDRVRPVGYVDDMQYTLDRFQVAINNTIGVAESLLVV
jgi:hypothetical protein